MRATRKNVSMQKKNILYEFLILFIARHNGHLKKCIII